MSTPRSSSNPVPEFKFTSDAANSGAEDYFTVVSFEASEGISRLYEYRIELKASVNHEPDAGFLDDVLKSKPCFTIAYKDDDEYPVYGMLSGFDENQTAGDYTYYTATLVPSFWQLTLNKNSKVFNDPSESTVTEILESLLAEYSLDYQIGDVMGSLLSKDYRCQFNETDFNFISRLLENEGIYYYFEQDKVSASDILIFSDGNAGDELSSDSEIEFDVSPSANKIYESISGWSCRKKRLTGNVALESYNPGAPGDDVFADHDVDTSFDGSHYTYGGDFIDDDLVDYKIDHFAQIRAEEFNVKNTRYYGESGVCAIRSGYTFSLKGHDNDAFNDVSDYLVIEASHQGYMLDATLSRESSSKKPQYSNSFVAIDSNVQYRPTRIARKPRFHGTISAVVYSQAPGEYAELDAEGRYRVLLPFKRSSIINDSDRASHYIRMAQPYSGGMDRNGTWVPEGTFFPLMDGTEVLLTFINGDPDRPIISGTVPNFTNPSVVNSDNSNQAVISTHGMYKLDVRGGSTQILEVNESAERGDVRGGNDDYTFTELNSTDASATPNLLDEESGDHIVTRRYGHEYIYVDGNTYKWDNEKAYSFGNDYEEIHERVDSADTESFDMQTPMRTVGTHPTGGDYSTWEDGGDGLIEKSWGDKCEYHEGRAFCWSGGAGPGGSLETYNYGNGYTENLLECSGGTAASNGLDTSHDSYTTATYKTNTIDPSNSTIEKTWGNAYSYTNGYSADIKVGDAMSEVYGDSKETIHGAADNKVMGATSDMFLGAKNEMCVNAANSMTVGLTNDLFIGGKIDTTLAVVMEISAGVKIEANGAAEMELKVVNGKLKLCEMDSTTAASLSTVTTALKNNLTAIKATGVSIQSGATEIKNKAVAMKNAAIQMLG